MLRRMIEIAHLLALADEYQRTVSIEDKTLSFRVFGDSKKLAALRAGADITTERFNSAIRWFSANWPEGASWPKRLERPRAA
jgi:hypothetical protein